MYEHIEQNMHHFFLNLYHTIHTGKRSNKFIQHRGQILSDIWPVIVRMCVFMTSNYLLRGESHVDPSVVYFFLYCIKQGTSLQATSMLHKTHLKYKILHFIYNTY